MDMSSALYVLLCSSGCKNRLMIEINKIFFVDPVFLKETRLNSERERSPWSRTVFLQAGYRPIEPSPEWGGSCRMPRFFESAAT